MMLRDRISLTWRYGKPLFLVGAVYNLFCAHLLVKGFSYPFFVDVFLLKLPFTALALYLVRQFRDRDALYFYINLGLSRRRLLAAVLLTDFLAMSLLLTAVLLIYG